jgi:hypothetical protein
VARFSGPAGRMMAPRENGRVGASVGEINITRADAQSADA